MKLCKRKSRTCFRRLLQNNIAAYQLAELIGLDDMLPVYVERKWQGPQGRSVGNLTGQDGRRRSGQKEDLRPPITEKWKSRCTASRFR